MQSGLYKNLNLKHHQIHLKNSLYIYKTKMKDFNSIVSKKCNVDSADFWKALEIWLKNPHLINRRILTSTQLFLCKVVGLDSFDILEWFNNVKKNLVVVDNIKEHAFNSLKQSLDGNILIEMCCDLEDIDYSHCNDDIIYFQLAKLLPRHPNKFSQTLELSLINIKQCSVLQFFYKYIDDPEKKILGFEYPYQVKYKKDEICVQVYHSDKWENNANLVWLQENFFPRILKWIDNEKPKNSIISGSLKLVSPEKYIILYSELKAKYGKEIIKIWPENTDPLKFVYEDIAIATYLLLLWQIEREKLNILQKQSFVDLGCGNGLLVYILNSEGHSGFGIDLRKRKIWDLYPDTTELRIEAIVPSSKCLYPEIDWVIGNHSDELTPWIPVIAARSSFKCRFFLLPCCTYEFNGKKYQRESATVSQYQDYMLYIKNISEKCGFKTDIDKLRIPSTKRICLIGSDRNYMESEMETQDFKIQEMINSRCNDNQVSALWAAEFKPRENTERVRNCTQVNKNIITSIIETVVTLLLKKNRGIDMGKESGKIWNAGGEIELHNLADIIDPQKLKELKKECGGLQTLLKNNGQIFKVESGKVRFRIPGKDKIGNNKKSRNSKIRKVKICWFFKNHPDGCPLDDLECDFKHE